MEQYWMGIDRGSTNIKVAVYDALGKEAAVASTPLTLLRPEQDGWAEQDMEDVWMQCVATIQKFFHQSGISPTQITAIGFSGHGGGLYALDRAGRPVRNAILSMDSRAYHEDQARRKQGQQVPQVSKADVVRLLQWVKEHEPARYRRIYKVMAAKDWLRYRMTGELFVSRSDFGLSVLMDPVTKDYRPEVLRQFGIEDAQGMLLPFREPWDLCGSVTEEAASLTGLSPGTPCIMGGHDCALASFGVGGCEQGHLSAILGTFSMNMLVCGREQFPTLPGGAYGMYNLSVLPDRWLYMNSTLSGRSLDWFLQTFCREERVEAAKRNCSVYALLEKSAAEANPASKVIFHPYVLPTWDHPPAAHVGLYGADMNTTRSDILRAVLEGIAFAEVDALQSLLHVLPANMLVLAGGAAKNQLWGQIFADLLQIPVFVPDLCEAACRGAALSAGIGIGQIRDHAAAAKLPLTLRRRYFPGSSAQARMEEQYASFQLLAQRCLPYWRTL